MSANSTETSTVCRCNRLCGQQTLHPLASVVDLRKGGATARVSIDCYAVLLAGGSPGVCRRGPYSCDYSDAAVLFAPPGRRVSAAEAPEGRLLLFHPDLVRSEGLGARMPLYTFFGYRSDETLRLSARERRQVERCLDYIDEELHWGIDSFSRPLLCNKIELLLNYCLRYYARQFTLRHDISERTIAAARRRLDDYLLSGRTAEQGLPGAAEMARWAGHSEAYTADMLRHETGCGICDFVQSRRLAAAKRMLLGTPMTVGEVASALGFGCEQAFRRLFTRLAGCTPAEYRHH